MGENGSRAAALPREVVEALPFGILVVDARGMVESANAAARDWLEIPDNPAGGEVSCCKALGCEDPEGPLGGRCIAEVAREAQEALPEIRFDLASDGAERAVWATAAPLGQGDDRIVIHLRPGDPGDRRRRTNPHWLSGPRIRMRVLGRTSVESSEGAIGGRWLDQRPGQILKYLASRRGDIAHTEEIAESIWPGSDSRIAGSVRHFVHVLREVLEPGRPKRRPSSFVVFEKGGYRLHPQRVELDVDEFERCAREGIRAAHDGDGAGAAALLERAVDLYRGDFVADEPYADWALAERERLRSTAVEAFRALAELRLGGGDADGATQLLVRLADMQPFDTEVQRNLIELLLRCGRRSEARRRYAALRARLMREFGEEPEFALADLSSAGAASPPGD
jgi:DNA-binding SARP family transcriptional activator